MKFKNHKQRKAVMRKYAVTYFPGKPQYPLETIVEMERVHYFKARNRSTLRKFIKQERPSWRYAKIQEVRG